MRVPRGMPAVSVFRSANGDQQGAALAAPKLRGGSDVNIETNVCGHCGTEVTGGYEVCRGCGARYTRHVGRAIRGVVCVVLGFAAAVVGLLYLVVNYGSDVTGMLVLLGGVAGVFIGMKHIRDGWRKAWWQTS